MKSTDQIAEHLALKLEQQRARLCAQWNSSGPVQHFVVDDCLPIDVVDEVTKGLPVPSVMRYRRSLRERKWTSVVPSQWGEACRAVLVALHSPIVLEALSGITAIRDLLGDPTFYGSGVSWMGKGCFLNPHVDNSGHPSIGGYRRLNALYYVSPDWRPENGGNLELWAPDRSGRVEVVSYFNRLVLMNTNQRSLHSVNPVRVDAPRICLSNYYYTRESPHIGRSREHHKEYSHITSFRGRPGQPLRDLLLRLEGVLGSKLARWLRK